MVENINRSRIKKDEKITKVKEQEKNVRKENSDDRKKVRKENNGGRK